MADSAAAPDKPPSPFLAQYLAAKQDHPDALLFFRMGDFYELFFDDAVDAASVLGITLTKRGQHQGEDIPMAGVPWRQAEAYLAKLIRAGRRVAICDQVEDPAEARKRGSKSVVRREVVRLVTPGTITEEGLLDAAAPSRLVALAVMGPLAGLAAAEISTGALELRALEPEALAEALAELRPAELLVAQREEGRARQIFAGPISARPDPKADAEFGRRRAQTIFEVAELASFGDFSQPELAALGLLLDYVELTQAGALPRLSPPAQRAPGGFLAIDEATRASLEIDQSVRGEREGSLLAAMDRSLTSAGARLLAERLARPLTDAAAIAARLDAVAWFVADGASRHAVRAELRGAPDLGRALTRLLLGRGGPRDLAALASGFEAGRKAVLRAQGVLPSLLDAAARALSTKDRVGMAEALDRIQRALVADPPHLAREGGFIAPGFDASLDAARELRDDSRKFVAGLQARYAEETGLPGLKLRHNGVLGYHIDATPKQAETLTAPPHAARFIHRQSTASSIRFTTTELAELDAKIARAGEAALARELAVMEGLVAEVAALEGAWRAAAAAIAEFDVAAALAEWADEVGAVRPDLDDTSALLAEGVRHPVVERALRREGKGFTPNDVRLDGQGLAGPRLLLVTGPNMAGKSTYLRQIALLVVLAQAGSFVPARRARLGLADRLFARVGASDDLARGRSTFMMEMIETAAILHRATPKSVVVLDEIGRGTATFDGLAIAWATAEHLHGKNRARTVFATHYHELTVLSDRLEAAANAHLRAKEWKGDLVFLHDVAPGPADRSYGVHVAKLAGMPRSAVDRARAVLARLEAGKAARIEGPETEAQPSLFSAPPGPSPVEEALSALDPDRLSPREALDALYALRALMQSAEQGEP